MVFEVGHAKLGGRKKGTPNAIDGKVREALLKAGEAFELDGKRGLHVWAAWLRDKEPASFANLVGKLMRSQVDVDHKLEVGESLIEALHALNGRQKMIDAERVDG